MTTKQIPVWIDCDTGTDDSVAIMLAHALPELSVVALSAVAGHITVGQLSSVLSYAN